MHVIGQIIVQQAQKCYMHACQIGLFLDKKGDEIAGRFSQGTKKVLVVHT